MKTNAILPLALGLIALCFSSCVEEPIAIPISDYDCNSELTNTHPDGERFQSFLNAKVTEGFPGISLLIDTPEGVWSGAAGKADIPNNIDMQACHPQLIGSITKVFTAILIHQLIAEGELDFMDTIGQYLSLEIRNQLPNAKRSTVRDLLQHTSGIPEFLDIPFSLAASEVPRRAFTAEEILRYAYPLGSVFAPGTQIAYSNSNYTLLGLIAERITGQRGEDLYQNRIFNRLGMDDTFFDQDGGIPTGISRAYYDRYDNGRLIDATETNAIRASMAGGIVSTPEDMRRFARAVFNDGPLLDEDGRQAMLTLPEVPFNSPDDFEFDAGNRVIRNLGFGTGLITLETIEGIAIGFNGGYQGRKARMWYWPEADKLIIYFINGSGGEINEASRRMFRNEMVELLFD